MSECNYTYDIDYLEKIFKKFQIKGEIVAIKPLTQGHINKTYDIVYQSGERYILQYINSYVFKAPKAVMQNTALVTSHIKNELIANGVDPTRQVLDFFLVDGKNYYVDELGDFWRLRINIQNSISYSQTSDLNIIEEAGRAFGNFQNLLSNFDAAKLNIVIPHFHNTKFRFEELKKAAQKNVMGKLDGCQRLYDQYLSLRKLATKMYQMQINGKLPLRVTHNDTKINNVLFDKDTNKRLAVIDLDTIMPGVIGFDYGDAIRFTANASLEDEEDLSKVYLDFDKFMAFTKGFVGEMKNAITKEELQTLALGAVTMTVECGVRFLTDYLCGDRYFCVDYSKHNLVRSRCQLALAKDMIRNLGRMQSFINEQ